MINVITTVDKRETLERIGRQLLESRLVACVQVIGPIRSTYRWNGRIEEAEEWMGVMKTRDELYDEVERELRAIHPYEVPEIVAVRAERVFEAYGKWVVEETSQEKTVDEEEANE
jgi:periplasmic divalent cation tolerance protein